MKWEIKSGAKQTVLKRGSDDEVKGSQNVASSVIRFEVGVVE